MKLLHTGDLHLGKSLHETSLIEDQKYMLDQLRRCLAKDTYSALLLAGDIYDRTIPGSDAVDLFSDFLVRLRADFPDLEICIIPGNHDSAQRLSFADRILGHQHIHIVGNPEHSFDPVIIRGPDGEKAALFLLPFLAAGTLKPRKTDASSLELDFDGETQPILVSQADLAAEAARRFSSVLAKSELAGIPAVLLAHLFTISGKQSESERLFIGAAEQVSPSLFSPFAYVALGHLHCSQRVAERMYYAGSPLAYAFDEAGTEKVFLKVEIDCTSAGFPLAVTRLPVQPFRKTARLSGKFSDFYTGTEFDRHTTDYIEISLTDTDLVANPMSLLRQKFPYLLSLKQGMSIGDGDRVKLEGRSLSDNPGEKRDPAADFALFEEMLHGFADPGKTALFAGLLAECTDET